MKKEEKIFLPPLLLRYYLITDTKQCSAERLPQIVREALSAGFKAIQLREKDMATIELYNLALKLREITAEANALLIINDRIDIHLAVGADGVHLGWKSIPVEKVRSMLGSDDWIGVSAHSVEEAIKAEKEGASYITISPIYRTHSEEYFSPRGVSIIEELKLKISIPIIALGGINETNAKDCFQAGATGVAMISRIVAAADPYKAAKSIIDYSI